MAAGRRLKVLRSAVKDYSPLTVHHWKTSGSKTGFHARGSELARGIARTILERPDERWLVVVHKPDTKVGNVEKQIRKDLAGNDVDVSFISWGQHMATNEYADVGNLILAGTLFMRKSHYVGLTHLSQDRPTNPGFATPVEVMNTERGEHANLILQAVCRGSVRKSDGSKCHPMNAYIIAASQSGISEALPNIFPSCDIRQWLPEGPAKPVGKVKDAIRLLTEEVTKGIAWISLRSIRESLKMTAGNFSNRVTGTDHWVEALGRLKLVPQAGPRGTKGLRQASPNGNARVIANP